MASLILLLFTFNLWASESVLEEYELALDEANVFMEKSERNLFSCPGVKLVVTCGNKLCEPHLNESDLNCPADCRRNVSVRSYNNITLCTGYSEIQIPQTTMEVADLVKKARAHGLKVRAIGASHSATEVMCSEGLLVPMEKMDKVYGISTIGEEKVVEAEAGITVFKLSEWLHEKGYALAGLPHMGFRDVTIAGAMATGSHGSTVRHHGVISNIVEAIEFVDGQGNIQYLEKNSSDKNSFKALSASLGLLGIVTKVKFRIQKQFNLAVDITYHSDEQILKKGLINEVKDCDYGQLNWFPQSGKYMRTCGVKTDELATAGANNELLSPKIPDFIVNPFKKVLQLSACLSELMCLVEKVRWLQYKLQPPMVVTNARGKKKNMKHLVGPAHRMVSSHLIARQEGFFQMDWEIAVPASKAQAALLAIKEHVRKNETCLPLVGVFIRFAPIEDETLIAHTAATGKDWVEGGPAVFFEMPVYVPVGFSAEQFMAYEKPFVEFARMLIERFSGRPHWGKNRQWTFDLVKSNGAYENNLELFQKAKSKYDPEGLFTNDFGKSLGLE